jgi:hypothetical protein
MFAATGTALAQSGGTAYPNVQKFEVKQQNNPLHALQTIGAATTVKPEPAKAAGDTLLAEGFETVLKPNLPEGWTSNAVDPGDKEHAWVVESGADAGGPAHSGENVAYIRWNATDPHDAWLYSKGMELTAGQSYLISFWTIIYGAGNNRERLAVKIGAEATVGGMTHQLFDNNGEDYYPLWTLVSKNFVPAVTGTYYLGFHSYSDADGNITLIDDVCVKKIFDNDLQIVPTAFPYAQVPVSQLLPSLSAKALNNGLLPQTNITFSAQLNGTDAGTGTPVIASLNSGLVSAAMTVAPSAAIQTGENTVVYSVTQTEQDADAANNSAAYTFAGTVNLYAADTVTALKSGIGMGTGTVIMGNIFDITATAAISQVVVGFVSNSAPAGNAYNINLYRMNGELSVETTPLLSQPAVRPTGGFAIEDVPATELAAGRYLLCVEQTVANNIGVAYDSNTAKAAYLVNAATGALTSTASLNLGALAIRMVTAVDECTGTVSDLNAVPDFNSVELTWTAANLLSYAVTLSDGTNTYTQTVLEPRAVFTGISDGTDYTWSVTGRCSAASVIETVGGEPFSTQSCVINSFPYREGFDDYNKTFHPCWTVEKSNPNYEWKVVGRVWAGGDLYISPFEGEYMAQFYGGAYEHKSKLITPQMDISQLAVPTLRFMHTQAKWGNDLNILRIYYKSSADGEWTLLHTYDTETLEWTERVIALPNPSADYYIAFEGELDYAHGIQIDNVVIEDYTSAVDAEVLSITPVSGIYTDLSGSEEITVRIRNNNSESLSGFSLKLELDGEEVATETFDGTIGILGEEEYTFNATVDLSAAADYEITVTVIAEDDQNSGNDSKTVSITNIICTTIAEFPWNEGFEMDVFPPACWSAYNPAGTTAWYRNTDDAINGTPPGVNTGHGSIGHDRNVAPDDWIITPAIAIPAEGAYVLKFYSHNQFHSGGSNEYSGVWISTTGNDPSVDGTFAEIKELTGAEVEFGMQQIAVSLSEYAGETVYIAFRYQKTNHRWFIDDVSIEEAPLEQFTVTYEQPANGTLEVTADGEAIASGDKVDYNTVITITAAPAEGYELNVLTVNGADFASGGTHNVIADVKIVCTFKDNVGINKNSLTNVTVYGNNNNVHIVNPNSIALKSVQVIDVLGRMVYSGNTAGSVTIPVNNASGIYMVRLISDDNRTLTAKVHLN